jgi:hypothetical protein
VETISIFLAAFHTSVTEVFACVDLKISLVILLGCGQMTLQYVKVRVFSDSIQLWVEVETNKNEFKMS